MSDKQLRVHENFTESLPIEGPSDRAFGLTFAAFFLLIALVPLVHHRPLRVWALALSGLLIAVSFAFPHALGPFNRLWTKFGLLLAKITNPIVTGLMFYLLFTPIAFIRRLRGNDPLHMKIDADAKSYWIVRTPPGPAPETMRNLF